MTRDFHASEIAATLESPGFLLPAPKIWHSDLIPPGPLAAMSVSWQNRLFLPRPIRIAVVENACVVAEGLVFDADGEVVTPTVQQHSQADIDAGREAIRAAREGGGMPHIPGEVLLCRKPGSGNYGHWLAEMAPKIWVLAQHHPAPFAVLIQEVGGPIIRVMAETLIMLGLGQDRVHVCSPAPVTVERLIVVDGLTHHGTYMSPFVTQCMDALTEAIAPRGSPTLFVTRGAIRSRRFVDEPAVLDRVGHAGFSVIEPAAMPLRAQVAAFRAASTVAGATGAAMANLLFVQPGSRAITFTPSIMPDTFFWFIAGHRGIDLTDIRCRSAGPLHGPAPWDGELILENEDYERLYELARSPPDPVRPALDAYERLISLFDRDGYLARYADVAQAGVDPLLHYVQHGAADLREPGPAFNAAAYLARYGDVAATGQNPLLHYVLRGELEGRAAEPA